MEWTLETYRLDEIERKFDLPCVICVNEGYYSETDAEGFSQGDIMSIDSKMVLHKVAANFAFKGNEGALVDPNYVQLVENEILVPLNYKGKLKVLRDVKNFNSIRELSNEFPRYAKVRENMKVTADENIQVTVRAGTVIELDRIIPGHVTESGKQPDKLVIQFQHHTGGLIVAVPLDVRGRFCTEPDNNEYTIKEAIDRYSLPQLVRFEGDEIKRVYTQDLLEGIENMRTVTTETLCLNRLVTQKVLVGHYKPLDETETQDTVRFRQRTLVVLPIDNPEIREIEVNVLKGVTDDIYEEVFLVRNVSKTNSAQIVDGSLYVDFAMAPGIKLLPQIASENEVQSSKDKPPPRPPKAGNLKSRRIQNKPTPMPRQRKAKPGDDDYVKYDPAKGIRSEKKGASPKARQKIQHPMPQDSAEQYDYEYPEKKADCADYTGFSLADLNFNTPADGKLLLENKTSRGKDLISNLKNKFKPKAKVTPADEEPLHTRKQVTATVNPRRTVPEPIVDEEDEGSDRPVYDEVNEWTMDVSSHTYKRPPKPKPVSNRGGGDRNTYLKPAEVKHKPTAHVAPSNKTPEEKIKQFKDLNNTELVERINVCGLNEFAEFCKKERLNGAFFTNITKEMLTEEMNLTGIPLYKFLQMRDNNWVPT